jgi:hypothetical protein
MWYKPRFCRRLSCSFANAMFVYGFLTAILVLPLHVEAQQGSPGGQGGQGGQPRSIPLEVAAAFQEMGRIFQEGTNTLNKRDYSRAEQAFKAAYDIAAHLNDRYSMGDRRARQRVYGAGRYQTRHHRADAGGRATANVAGS